MFFAPILLSAAFVSANIGASGSDLIQPTKQQVAIASDGSGRAPSQHPMSSLLQVQLASRLAARLGVKNDGDMLALLILVVIAIIGAICTGIYYAYDAMIKMWGTGPVVGGTIFLVLLIIGAIVWCCIRSSKPSTTKPKPTIVQEKDSKL
jgi:hypothetical protein